MRKLSYDRTTARLRRRPLRETAVVPAYPKRPRELAGKWVAWSKDRRIVASGDTLAEVVGLAPGTGTLRGVSYERIPRRPFPA